MISSYLVRRCTESLPVLLIAACLQCPSPVLAAESGISSRANEGRGARAMEHATATAMVPDAKGAPMTPSPMQVADRSIAGWKCDDKRPSLDFTPSTPIAIPPAGVLYLKIAYLDEGFGKIDVQAMSSGGSTVKPDRFLGLWRSDTHTIATAEMRLSGLNGKSPGDLTVRIGMGDRSKALCIESVTIQDKPFDDPRFAFLLSDPWKGPYTGPTLRPHNNTTLKGKVMVGYQGWFRTPNDPEGRGWVHWGDIQNGTFTTDMWPDVTQYPSDVLEKTASVKTRSGKPGLLFSSAWPGAVNTHFRWMREHNIDGAYVQRFVSANFYSNSGKPEWVLANVRAAANREGRLWAVEYDVSGYPDARLLETLKTDWKWFVDNFGVLKDPNYAREGGKPVVFLWGMTHPDRKITPSTANAVVDFFKNDPRYGGNYVIGGIAAFWRNLSPAWQEHLLKYDCVSPWMSQSYAEDIADFKKLGLTYLPHVKPGFSWANLMHQPSDEPNTWTPREGGAFYWSLLSKAAQAGIDRLFVGMFDEYDEGTAIMPMTDDPPPTPSRPGVAAIFHSAAKLRGHGITAQLPNAQLTLGDNPPAKNIPPHDFSVRMVGTIVFPAPGNYTFSLEGVAGDDATLSVGGKKFVDAKRLSGEATASRETIAATAGQILPFRIDYRHGAGAGTLSLFWESSTMTRRPVPAEQFRDAWGRFLTNEGQPSDWWLTLTNMGKEMILGKRPVNSAMPALAKPSFHTPAKTVIN